MKEIIKFEDFLDINWFKNLQNKDVITIKEQFLNFPERKYLNLAVFQFDLFEYNDCEDYHYIVNKLFHKVINKYPDFQIENINCLKRNKIEIIIKGKKYKKSFRVNGSRFDTDALLDFLNSILFKNGIKEQFYLLSSSSDIKYPVLASSDLIEKAKSLELIAVD